MSRNQQTVAREVSCAGVGLHSGERATVRLKPALPDTGITFARVDLPGAPRIPVGIASIRERMRQTALANGQAEVQTVEHLLAAVRWGGIDNALVEIDGPEVPGMDGSALPFVEMVRSAGVVDQGIERRAFRVEEPVAVSDGDVSLVALPYREGGVRVTYTLAYADSGSFVDSQHLSVLLDPETFSREVAPARTFVLESEIESLRKMGLGKGADYQNTLVIGRSGVVKNELRFPDELVRHKILDLCGDLAILGTPIEGHLVAVKSGHRLNQRLVHRLHERILTSRGEFSQERGNPKVQDIYAILKRIPHRYPMLLVDRILDLVPGKRAVGVKNVTINEPFFQGHYPGHPIMPGVLQIEAMAQVAGAMMMDPEHGHKLVPYLMTLDKVKLRKTVIPGDRLLIEADAVRIRERMGQVNVRALVEGVVVAEAQMKFILAEPG